MARPVGMFAALRLAQTGISVTILDQADDLCQLPRACIYYPQVQVALDAAGVYDDIIKAGGFRATGLEIRQYPEPAEDGSVKAGRCVVSFPKVEDPASFDPYGAPSLPSMERPAMNFLQIPQPRLTKVLMDKALATGKVQVLFHKKLMAIANDADSVTATVWDTVAEAEETYTAAFLIGADGAKSKTRSLLGIQFPGHTWPERLVATDVWLPNSDESPTTTALLMDPVNYVILSPLTPPRKGEMSKWRVTYALDPEEMKAKSEEYFLAEEYVAKAYERVWAGPRPLTYKIDRVAPYTVHQRLATSLRKGRCLLAGDAAHINNVSSVLVCFLACF